MTVFAELFLALTARSEADVAVRDLDGDLVVDAAVGAIDPLEFVRLVAAGANRRVEGAELLVGRTPIDVGLSARPIDQVLELVAHATRTRIAITRDAVVIEPEHTDPADLQLDAEAAWVSLLRDFPGHEVARFARVELGALQERRGNEDAALTHYDAAWRDAVDSKAADRALHAAGSLLGRRGEWSEAMRRWSRLAQTAQDPATQIEARLAISRSLSEQGRGAEALALVDVVDLSYPAERDQDVAQRRLARARAHLAAGAPAEALRELDRRAASDPRLGGTPEDLGLRARALDELGAPLEAARSWLACSSVANSSERADALYAAARASASGGDDLAVLFVDRLARGGARETEVARLADAARARLGLADDDRDLVRLETRWQMRSSLAAHERAQLASDLVAATARERGVDAAAAVARTALAEVPESEARAIRSALALVYENEGAWSEAARAWGGSNP